jgi:hypothetical protein
MQTPKSFNMESTIQDLHANRILWYKIHVLVYDLRHFQEKASQARLECVMDSSYLSLPYFTASEAAQLKATPVHNNTKKLEVVIQETLDERLQRRMKKRVQSGDFRICAAHDLAPILEKALDIKPKELERDRDFLALVEQFGLDLREAQSWSGVVKKPGQKKKNGRR